MFDPGSTARSTYTKTRDYYMQYRITVIDQNLFFHRPSEQYNICISNKMTEDGVLQCEDPASSSSASTVLTTYHIYISLNIIIYNDRRETVYYYYIQYY